MGTQERTRRLPTLDETIEIVTRLRFDADERNVIKCVTIKEYAEGVLRAIGSSTDSLSIASVTTIADKLDIRFQKVPAPSPEEALERRFAALEARIDELERLYCNAPED